MNEQQAEYLTVTRAREIFGISKVKMASLIREGVLLTKSDPLNKRVKMVKRTDVEALVAGSAWAKKALARAA